MLSQLELNHFQKQLTNLLRRLNVDRDQVSDEALRPGGGEASGGISNAPLHLADLGSQESEKEVDLLMIENAEHGIKEVGFALDRIDQGTFGQCEECGKGISKERLRILPYTRYCIRCATEMERETQSQ